MNIDKNNANVRSRSEKLGAIVGKQMVTNDPSFQHIIKDLKWSATIFKRPTYLT